MHVGQSKEERVGKHIQCNCHLAGGGSYPRGKILGIMTSEIEVKELKAHMELQWSCSEKEGRLA